MALIKPGTGWDLVLLLIMVAASYYYIRKATRGEKLPDLRRIPAVDAIYEGVGRSIELNKPVHFAMGASGGQLYTTLVSMTLAGLAFLRYVAKLCARLGARLIVHMPYQAESIPLIEGVVREAYREEGKLEEFRREDLRYHGYGSLTWSQAIAASFAREGVGLNLEVGIFYSDCPISLEMAKIQGGMNIGGTGRWIMVYAFAMMCDYCFLGEEIYAGAAKVSDNPLMVSGIIVEEVGKFFTLILIAICLILAALGVNIETLLSF